MWCSQEPVLESDLTQAKQQETPGPARREDIPAVPKMANVQSAVLWDSLLDSPSGHARQR